MSDALDSFLSPPAAQQPAAAPSGDVLGSFLAAPALPQVAKDEEGPGLVESGLRGIKQGVSFGFGDEITGALESAFTDKTYKQARDEARAADKAASDAHPVGYGLGQILGGVATAAVPGLGAATGLKVLGTGFAANAARGAAAGLLAGAGDSEAEDVKGIAQDAAKGGLVGGTLGGILGTAAEKYVHGAPARADKALVSEIGERATPTQRARLAGKGEEVVNVAREYGLDKVARKPGALVEATNAAKQEVGEQISHIYQQADSKSAGVPLASVSKGLQKIEQEYRSNPATAAIADSVKKQIEDVHAVWKEMPAVPAEEVRKFATALGDKGFAGSGMDPKTQAQMQRKAWAAMKDVLSEHVDNVLPGEAKRLTSLNKQYSSLMDIGKAATKRAALDSFAPTGLRQIAGHGLDVVGGLTSLATGSPVPYLATKVGMPAAKATNRAATNALARLARAAKTGSITAAHAQDALSAGVPRSVVEAWAPGLSQLATPAPDEATQ